MKYKNNQFKLENEKQVQEQLLKDLKKEKVICLIELTQSLDLTEENILRKFKFKWC